MTNHGKGWAIFLGCMAVLLTSVGIEIGNLSAWTDATTPAFVSKIVISFGVATGSFIGGRKIPTGD